MINGERCTRACGFCLVDTRHPRAPRPRRARARGRGGGPHGPGPRRGHRRRPRRPARRRRRRVRRHHRRHPPPRPGVAVEVLIPDCKGDPAALGDDLRRPPRRAEPQPRDGGPPPAGGAPVGVLRPQPGRAGPGQGGRPGHQVGPHRRHGRDRRRGRRRPGRPARRRRRHRHHRPVPAPHGAPPAGGPLVDARRVRRPQGRRRGHGHRPRRGLPAHPVELPRPPGGRGGPAWRADDRPQAALDAARSPSSGSSGSAHGRPASTPCCCRSAPTCRGSPATRPCRSSASRCWCCRPTATPPSSCPASRRRGSSTPRRVRHPALVGDRGPGRHRGRPGRRPALAGRLRPHLGHVPAPLQRRAAGLALAAGVARHRPRCGR